MHQQGSVRLRGGEVEAGLSLLDEAMVAVTAGELSPIATGLIYCSVIEGCQQVYELRRAQEWTAALTRWCEQQPDLVAFTGRCLVHRAEIMQVRGRWDEALDEARGAAHGTATAQAHYRQGELHRLRGEHDAAEQAYRAASRAGREPQPGLALLRLAQGRADAAAAAIRRATGEAADPPRRAALLPAFVEIALATGDLERRPHRRRGARRARRDAGERDARRQGRARERRAAARRAAIRGPPSARCARPRTPGRRSRRRTRERACASWSGSPAARSATRTRR